VPSLSLVRMNFPQLQRCAGRPDDVVQSQRGPAEYPPFNEKARSLTEQLGSLV